MCPSPPRPTTPTHDAGVVPAASRASKTDACSSESVSAVGLLGTRTYPGAHEGRGVLGPDGVWDLVDKGLVPDGEVAHGALVELAKGEAARVGAVLAVAV